MVLLKLRKLTTNKKTGDCFGLTVPSNIALNQKFSGCNFYVRTSGTNIIFSSGCINGVTNYE